ncbi:MAG TPA: hypothetical protein VLA59_05225 [Patescibacteria group bacterium]|nr:hypothetical protein [Patescibacteria group bacterium]
MRAFSSDAHGDLIGTDDDPGVMDAIRLSRVTLALLIIVVMVGGVLLGSAVTAMVAPTPTPTPTPTPAATPSDAAIPTDDVAGEDLERLPRYPGSVRTEYEVSIDDRYRLTAVEYFADATIDEVRLFYQGVIEEHGWERADIQYSGGEWTYVLVDGSVEALIEIEVTRGNVEIDLQVSAPIASPSPSPSESPSPTPEPTRPPPAAPPPAPPPGDDDDDDDDDDGDDSDDGADSDD